MVPADELSSVRTVEDVVRKGGTEEPEVLGTKVGDKVFSTDPDTLFALQGALGYEITQTLFIGKHTLIVEGPSDLLYLRAMTNELKRRGKTGLSSDWTISPAGGIDKVQSFLSLFAGNKLNVAILTDIAKGQKGKVDSLKQARLLEQSRILMAAEFCGQDEADIEDLLGEGLYLKILNAMYALTAEKTISRDDLKKSGEKSVRIVKQAEAVLRLRPELPEFDHLQPASFLLQNPKLLQGKDADDTIARFESLFSKLNGFL